jgi:putative ABC transport system permease protein
VEDARTLVFGGAPLATAVVTRGVPATLPDGLTALSNAQVRKDTLHQMKDAIASIDSSRGFMWVVASVIVAALMYVSALERLRDFAVLKSLGASSPALFAGVAVQAVIIALIAAGVAAAIVDFLKPVFAVPVVIPSSAFLLLPLAALVVGLVASLVALRRAVSVDPAVAFAGA